MSTQTPTKELSRVHLTPISKRILCVICGKQSKNKYERLLLFNKGAKTRHCELIEKHLQVEILRAVSYSDHVCRNCIRKLVTIENSVLNFVSTFNETRENLETSHGRQSKKRNTEPSSKRPLLFSTPDTRQRQSDLVSYLSMQ